MALINCPECGSEVSSEADSCPECGHPINAEESTEGESVEDESGDMIRNFLGSKWIVVPSLILFFPVGLYFMWAYSDWSKKTKWGTTGIVVVLALSVGIMTPEEQQSSQNSSPSAKKSENNQQKISGLGISLSQIKTIMDGHGFTLDASSESKSEIHPDGSYYWKFETPNRSVSKDLEIHLVGQGADKIYQVKFHANDVYQSHENAKAVFNIAESIGQTIFKTLEEAGKTDKEHYIVDLDKVSGLTLSEMKSTIGEAEKEREIGPFHINFELLRDDESSTSNLRLKIATNEFRQYLQKQREDW